MKLQNAVIDQAVFKLFPDFYRALVIVREASNAPQNPVVAGLLHDAAREVVPIDLEKHPSIETWNEVHRRFGSNPNKYPSSIKALLKRVAAGRGLPFINTAVALFNIISIKYIIPCGGDDVDKIAGDLVL